MDFANRLELFLDVVECGSFAKAADRKHIDRSVLSKQIKTLEETLGVRLLNRSTRSLSLTPAGQEIVQQARTVRDVLSETRNIAETFHSEPKGKIKVSSTTLFGKLYLKEAIKIFLDKFPQVSVEAVLDDHKVDVISEGYDVVFRIGVQQDSNMVARVLAKNAPVILASKAFIERYGHPQTPEELAKLPAIIYSNGERLINKLRLSPIDGSEDISTYSMQGRYMVNEAELIIDGIQSGFGYGILTQFMLTESLEDMGLVQLLPDYQLPSYGDIYAMYSHRNQPPLVKAFIDIVQQVIGTPPVWKDFL